jgi:transcriptional regulator with XRE-family HTH domain
MPRSTLGNYIRAKRLAAGISLRRLAREIGVSAVYLGEVERGLRAGVSRERWPALEKHVPGITRDGLERHAAQSGPLQLDLTDTPPTYQNIGYALARRIERRDLSDDDCGRLLELLGTWETED